MVARTETVGGVTVAVQDEGPPAPAHTVVLLHGNPDTHHVWRGVVDHLARRHPDWRFVLPDMPGLGDSPGPPEGFDYRAGVTVPLWDGLFQALDLQGPLTVAVHDFGGPWLLPWVSRNAARVDGLVITNSPFSPGFRWHPWARVWQTPVLGELSNLLQNKWMARWEMRRGSKGLTVAHVDAAYDRATPALKRSMLRTYRSHADFADVTRDEHPRLIDALQHIRAQVVWGARDPYCPLALAAEFQAEVRAIPDAGHWALVEAPEALAEAIAAVAAPLPEPQAGTGAP